MKHRSNKIYRLDSLGNRWSSAAIERKISRAKAEKIEQLTDEFGRVVCQACKRNDCVPVDMAHIISVDKCKNDPRFNLELAWDLDNLIPLGRPCHAKADNNNIRWTNIKN